MPRGGRRPGAGRKKGTVLKKTLKKREITEASEAAATAQMLGKALRKEEAREKARVIITSRMEELLDAAIRSALGVRHLLTRNPDGKFVKCVSEEQIEEALRTDNQFWIYTKDPNTGAFTDLMNRAIDKPLDQKQQVEQTGEIRIRWIRHDENDDGTPRRVETIEHRQEVSQELPQEVPAHRPRLLMGSTDEEDKLVDVRRTGDVWS